MEGVVPAMFAPNAVNAVCLLKTPYDFTKVIEQVFCLKVKKEGTFTVLLKIT
jgi:hypothetical protein